MDNIYLQVLVQWLMLASLICIFLVPAFRFRKIARNSDAKGWPYFLVRLAVGAIVLSAMRWMFYYAAMYVPKAYKPYVLISSFVLAFGIIGVVEILFRNGLRIKK